jgi:hypothetical protein
MDLKMLLERKKELEKRIISETDFISGQISEINLWISRLKQYENKEKELVGDSDC